MVTSCADRQYHEKIDFGTTGRHVARVWEMSWDNTRHAGGADKNRVADDEIVLEAGAYRVIYVTDDSHAFGNWNSRPPRDPIHWGLTVRRID